MSVLLLHLANLTLQWPGKVYSVCPCTYWRGRLTSVLNCGSISERSVWLGGEHLTDVAVAYLLH